MKRRRDRWLHTASALSLGLALAVPAGAQDVDRGLIVDVFAGPHVAQSRNRFVGVERGIHLGFSVGRSVSAATSVALLLDLYAGSTMESIPGCVPDTPVYCGARTEYPGAMVGLGLESQLHPGSGRFGFSVGAGLATAPGAKGPVTKSSGTAAVGAEYQLRDSGVVPVLGVRLTRMFPEVAGVRWIAAPVVGIRF